MWCVMQRQSDFDAIVNFRSYTFFEAALGTQLRPLSPTLPHRMNARAAAFSDRSIQIRSKADQMAVGQYIEQEPLTYHRFSTRQIDRQKAAAPTFRSVNPG